jgi:hypothetical protein
MPATYTGARPIPTQSPEAISMQLGQVPAEITRRLVIILPRHETPTSRLEAVAAEPSPADNAVVRAPEIAQRGVSGGRLVTETAGLSERHRLAAVGLHVIRDRTKRCGREFAVQDGVMISRVEREVGRL